MKKFRVLSMMLLSAMMLPTMVACGGDDNDDTTGSVNHQVTISDDGKVSNGSTFSSIDDKNFYLDYIKYTITEGHLSVSGYDKLGFKGIANIVSSITYKGHFYEVLEIGNKAFYNCEGLTSVSIPNSVKSISNSAFYYCSNLTSITIPSSVTSIGIDAFYYCSNLTSITVESANPQYDSRNNCNAIIETSSNKLIVGCKKTTIPNSVTTIGNSAFYGCSGLTSITIPNSVTFIGMSAFEGCYGLTSITIPNSVKSITRNSFCNCSRLTSITIPNSVTSIEWHAFRYCNNLTTIVSEIENPFEIEYDVFDSDIYNTVTLMVPAGKKSAYMSTYGWKFFKNIIEVGL